LCACVAIIASSFFNNDIAIAFSWTTSTTTIPSRRHHISIDNTSKPPSCIQRQSNRQYLRILQNRSSLYSSSNIESIISSSIDDDDGDENNAREERHKPLWMKCINAVVPPNTRALNEAVAIIANISRSEANDLIEIGAVWARMDTLTEDDVLGQYYDDDTTGSSSSASIQYADLRSGWGSGDVNDELYNNNNESTNSNTAESSETMSLDEYIEQQMALRYRRILTPSTIDPGTDIRIYPHPRRFPSCYEFSDPHRLLYEDTTFLVVDKPPMLPVQPEPSNYEECCPGCVNLLLGPFHTIGGELVHRPLICHRVDSCVGGCVVLSKDGNGQRVFSDLQVCVACS
jgi:23S rRNA-/tRNA-specific pseudouridylate synthase